MKLFTACITTSRINLVMLNDFQLKVPYTSQRIDGMVLKNHLVSKSPNTIKCKCNLNGGRDSTFNLVNIQTQANWGGGGGLR